MADIKLIDAQGDERTYSGVAKVKIPLADGTGNATFIQPAGKKELTGTNEVDVTNFATAQVVDKNLIAENIKSGVSILGVEGTHKGGGEALPEYDGTVIIEKANSGLRLRRFKETITSEGLMTLTTEDEMVSYIEDVKARIYISEISLAGGQIIYIVPLYLEAEGMSILQVIGYTANNEGYMLEQSLNGTTSGGNLLDGVSVNVLSCGANVEAWLLANTEGVSV